MKPKTAAVNTKNLNIIKPENCNLEKCLVSIKLLEQHIKYYSENEPHRDTVPYKNNLEKFKKRLVQLTLN